ncbi:MAG TPA: ABC transporter, partial [Ruminococcaceae bacterium]|nr:ABC transporter [Oscillospiraceae bacterium]
MFYKLAFKNVRKSFRDYTVYFLTLMFAVCIFYLFNSLGAQSAMINLSKSQARSIQSLSRLIGYISVFVAVILGFLAVYANNFLMKRRKKELGVYMVLGMKKRSISNIIITETFSIGIVSL